MRTAPSELPEVVVVGSIASANRRAELRKWLVTLLRDVAPSARSAAAKFCGDAAMRKLNRELRGKDTTTDVLSFPGGDSPEGYHLGDIVISIPQARRQSEEAGRSLDRELRILLLHGVLHCLGYDHETDDGTMDRLERRLRRRWIA